MFYSPTKIRVAVLRGGPSHEYDMSLRTGGFVLKNLPEKYGGVDVLIDRSGVWHVGGLPRSPERILNHVDVVFNALHGHFGEDGQIQHILKLHAIPHTGSDTMSSVFAMNKMFSKNIFGRYGIRTPMHIILRKDDMDKTKIYEIFSTFPNPSIVKPVSSGSSVGVTIASNLHELGGAIDNAFFYGDSVILEEYIKGREATVGVIEGYRDENFYTLPVVEIKSSNIVISPNILNSFFQTEHKLNGGAIYDHQTFSPMEKAEAKQVAILAHKAVGANGYSRSDMIIHPKRGVYLLEVNTQPSLHEDSPFNHALGLVGAGAPHFLEHIITQAMNKK